MTIDEAINHFGSQPELAKALGIEQAAISNWKRRGGVVPTGVQFRLQVMTKGKLKADQPEPKTAA